MKEIKSIPSKSKKSKQPSKLDKNFSVLKKLNFEIQPGKENIMEIRYMTSADNRMTISRVYEESWKSAYKNIIPQDYLDSIPEGQWASNMDDPA